MPRLPGHANATGISRASRQSVKCGQRSASATPSVGLRYTVGASLERHPRVELYALSLWPGKIPAHAQLSPQFHAGNHADVLKHLVLLSASSPTSIARDGACWVIDTPCRLGSLRSHRSPSAKLGPNSGEGVSAACGRGRTSRPRPSTGRVRDLNPDGRLATTQVPPGWPGKPCAARIGCAFRTHSSDSRLLPGLLPGSRAPK